jgi:hypothetical protein
VVLVSGEETRVEKENPDLPNCNIPVLFMASPGISPASSFQDNFSRTPSSVGTNLYPLAPTEKVRIHILLGHNQEDRVAWENTPGARPSLSGGNDR